MDVKWWSELPDDTRRLVALCGIIIAASLSLNGYLYTKIDTISAGYEVKLDKKQAQNDTLREKLNYAEVDCIKSEYQRVKQLYEEQKALNDKQVAMNEKQREENERQKQINLQNRQTTETTKSVVQQIKAVITD